VNFLVPAWPVVVAWPGKGDGCIVRSGARALTVELDMEFNPYSETKKVQNDRTCREDSKQCMALLLVAVLV
jgi:hypothetical protein